MFLQGACTALGTEAQEEGGTSDYLLPPGSGRHRHATEVQGLGELRAGERAAEQFPQVTNGTGDNWL